MKMRFFSLRAACLFLAIGAMVATLLVAEGRGLAAPMPLGPKATLQRLNGSVDKLLRKKSEPGSDEDKRLKDDIKQRASELLEYNELCKRALGEHYGKMTEKQRTEFVATLRELIERNYVKQLRTNLDYEVLYGEESESENEATVSTVVKIRTKGKTTDAAIEYRLIKVERGWMVYDVITDELSLVRNYRSQFQRIIRDQGYDGLLTKMKTKLNEERDREAKEEKDRATKKT